VSDFGPPIAESESAISLRNSGLPARPRDALEALFAVASSTFEGYLQGALTEFEQHLFRLADQSRSNEAQQRHLDAMRDVRRARADVAPRFLLRLEHALASIDHPAAPPLFMHTTSRAKMPDELSLMDQELFEEMLCLQEIATRAELRYSQLLYLLGQRFAVMAGRQAFDSDELPLGPHRLCECLRTAVACLDLGEEYRLQLYRLCERIFFANAQPLYVLFNEVLIQHRILPHLAFHLPRIRRDEEGGGRGGTHPADAGAHAPRHVEPVSATEAESHASNATAASTRASSEDLPPAFRNPLIGWPGLPRAAPYDAGSPLPAMDSFDNLRSLLAWRRPVAGRNENASAEGTTASAEDLDVVLRELQAKPVAPIVIDGRVVPRSVTHLRQDLMNYLRRFSPEGSTPQLSGEDSDAMDLLGLLFEQLSRDQRPDSSMHNLLTRLQVPILRIALRDKQFFARPEHPARQLLNSVVEASHYWLDEESNDRNLAERMQAVVDRVSAEFEGDLRIFEDLTGDLSKQLGTLARKSEVAERRHVEAAKGREKLDAARAAAARAIDERVARHSPPALLRTLLEQAWADVLALTILRHTESSEIYRRRVQVTDRLIEVIEQAGAQELPSTPETLALREEVESGLKQIGYHDHDTSALTSRLFKDAQPEDRETTSLTELTIRLKARSRLGVDSAATSAGLAPALLASTGAANDPETHTAPLTDAEKKARHDLLALPFGTWFEFKGSQQGQTVRRKLAWYSELSGNCLLVNQRGARTEERTLDQLARELTRGTVSVIEAQSQSLLERRWSALVVSLKSPTGFVKQPEHAAATTP